MLMAPTCLANVENVFQPAEKLLLASPTQQSIDQSEQSLGLCIDISLSKWLHSVSGTGPTRTQNMPIVQ